MTTGTEQTSTVLALPAALASRILDEGYGPVLGITCHAVYHAGQVQLVKRLAPM